MAIKTFKPTTPSRRHMTVSAFEGIDKKAKPERALTEILKKNAGRNSYGRITVRHHGGGNKQKYRIIDFKRDKREIPAKVAAIEYDPNRSAFIALVQDEDGEKRDIIAPVGVKVGDVIEVREKSRSSVMFKKLVGEDAAVVNVPKWLESAKGSLRGTVVAMPARDDIDFPVEEHLIVELYSK